MRKEHQINFLYVVAALVGVLVVQVYWLHRQTVEQIPYSEFRSLLERGKVAEIVVGDTTIRGKLAKPVNQKDEFVTNKVNWELAEYLSKYKVPYRADSNATWLMTLLSWVVPTLIFVGVWVFAIQRMGGSTDRVPGGGDRQEQGACLSGEADRRRLC